MGRAIAVLLVVALPARAQDAGALPPAIFALRAELLLPRDGGWLEVDAPGGWLPEPTLVAEEKEHVRLRAENARLMESAPLFSRSALVFTGICAALGLLLGGYLGWNLRGYVSR